MAAKSGSDESEVEEEDGGDARESEEMDHGGDYYCSNYKRDNGLSARNGIRGFDFGFGL
jgi:hypothetical protein